jgi:hypothetical protein
MPEKSWYITKISGILPPKSWKRRGWYAVGEGGALISMTEKFRIRGFIQNGRSRHNPSVFASNASLSREYKLWSCPRETPTGIT